VLAAKAAMERFGLGGTSLFFGEPAETPIHAVEAVLTRDPRPLEIDAPAAMNRASTSDHGMLARTESRNIAAKVSGSGSLVSHYPVSIEIAVDIWCSAF
jgi:hypothetical protein